MKDGQSHVRYSLFQWQTEVVEESAWERGSVYDKVVRVISCKVERLNLDGIVLINEVS